MLWKHYQASNLSTYSWYKLVGGTAFPWRRWTPWWCIETKRQTESLSPHSTCSHPHIVVRSSQTCHNDIVIISNIEAFPLNALTLLVGSQEGHPARKKTEWWVAGMVICLERGADLHMAQLMPLLLTVSCFSRIQIGFTVLVPAHLGSPGHSPHR